MTQILLTWDDMLLAGQAGLMRTYQQRGKGAREHFKAKDGRVDWNQDIYAAAAEMAVAKLTGRYWTRPIGYDPNAADVGDRVEVKFTPHPAGHLCIKPRNNPERNYVLVTFGEPVVEGISFRAAGWIFGAYAMQQEYWRADVGQWWVPQRALQPVPIAGAA